MTTTYIARNTTLGDTFETNYGSTEGGTIEWIRQMTKATATEVESTWTLPNLATEKIVYHVEVGKLNWAADRVGAADWATRLRIGAIGDAAVDYAELYIKRVSADGNTIRATITVFTAGTRDMAANTNLDDTVSADTSLDQPAGAAADDHLVIVIVGDNTSEHGGAETVDIEQNTAAGTRLVAPIDEPASAIPPQAIIIG